MKTVIHKGKEYQINTVYSLSDKTHVVLEECGGANGFYVSRIDGDGLGWYVDKIFPSKLVAGTIKEVPIELEEGTAYQFDFNCEFGLLTSKGLVGICHKLEKFGAIHTMFESPVSGSAWNSKCCTNIVKLAPEVK